MVGKYETDLHLDHEKVAKARRVYILARNLILLSQRTFIKAE